eukprot:5880495-Lingulodinium_polyedra.AAC.1
MWYASTAEGASRGRLRRAEGVSKVRGWCVGGPLTVRRRRVVRAFKVRRVQVGVRRSTSEYIEGSSVVFRRSAFDA